MKVSDLERLIPQYALNKTELDSYKKICDKENGKIKSIMQDFHMSKYETGGWKATCYTTTKETIDEEILISLFTSIPAFSEINDKFNIIKTKSYIDFDALENAIYNNALTNDQLLELDKAKESKEVTTLRVTKIRKKGED